jgi:hypothetical protein
MIRDRSRRIAAARRIGMWLAPLPENLTKPSGEVNFMGHKFVHFSRDTRAWNWVIGRRNGPVGGIDA